MNWTWTKWENLRFKIASLHFPSMQTVFHQKSLVARAKYSRLLEKSKYPENLFRSVAHFMSWQKRHHICLLRHEEAKKMFFLDKYLIVVNMRKTFIYFYQENRFSFCLTYFATQFSVFFLFSPHMKHMRWRYVLVYFRALLLFSNISC